MTKEMESIEKNTTWELNDLPRGIKLIRVKCIFKTKCKETGEVDRFKAMLVEKRVYSTTWTRLHKNLCSCGQAQHHSYDIGYISTM